MSNFLQAAKYTDSKPKPHQMAAWQWAWELLTLDQQKEFLEMFRADPPDEKPGLTDSPYYVVAPLLELIRKYESAGSGGYNAVNRGRSNDTPGGWTGLTAMSIAEVMKAQASKKLFAAGAYQIVPATLKEVVNRAGLPTTMPFSEDAQDRFGVVLVLGGWKRPKLTAYLLGQSHDLNAAQDDLAYEWASLPGANGKGMYDGDGAGNRSHAAVVEVREVLAECRRRIGGRTLIQLGLVPPSPQEKPADAPQKGANILDIRGSEEAGLKGPKARLTLKPGESYLLVNDRDRDCEAYDWTGKLLWKAPALARGQSSDPRVHRGDTPPGLYKLGKLYADYEQDPSPRKTTERQSYGWYSFDMEELEGQEKAVGRAGIMLHGGGSACGWPGAWAAKQKLHPTLGCVRMHNIDLRDKVLPLYRQGPVFIGVYQD